MKNFLLRIRTAYLAAILENKRGIGPGTIRALASFLSLFYLAVVKVRGFLYGHGLAPTHKFAVSTVSVGNITCGGTGKTPVVEYVARSLIKKWRRPAILSRGYGAIETEDGVFNDEYLLLKQNLPEIPHYTGAERVKKLREAIASNEVDVVIVDDGFQNILIRRNIDLVLVDALNPFSNRHSIPRGLLREPISALARADAIIITRSNQCSLDELKRLRGEIEAAAPSKPILITLHRLVELCSPDGKTKQPCEWLAKRRIWAFCGIGNPESFRISLKEAQANVVGFASFPDHYHYSPDDVRQIAAEARRAGAAALITTQKDGVKLMQLSDVDSLPIYVLKIEVAAVHGGAEFQKNVLNL